MVTGALLVTLSLFNKEKGVFEVKAISDLDAPMFRASLNKFRQIVPGFRVEKIVHSPTINPLYKKLIKTKKIFLTKNLTDLTENLLPQKPTQISQRLLGIKMIALFPLISEGKVIGIMVMLSPKEIQEREIKVAQAFIGQIVLTLELEKALEEKKEYAKKRLSTLTPILQRVALGDFSVKPKIPKEEDEFTELLVALHLMIDDLREVKIAYKKAEEKTKESRDELKVITDNVIDVIFQLSPSGKIIYISPSVKQYIYFTQEEVIGTHFKKYVSLKDIPRALEAFKQVLSGREVQNLQMDLKRKDGTLITTEINTRPLYKEGKIIASLAIARDISERAYIEKMKTEFISIAAHQLRTPLTTINWYAETLLSGDVGEISVEQKKYLEKVYQSNKRMIRLVNALLNASRIDLGTFAIQPQPANLIEIADHVLDELLAEIKKKKLKIKRNYDKKLPMIKVDSNLTHIFFQNLLSNSVKYSPKYGRVTLTIKKQKPDILIKVSDTGYGIPKNQQSKIFTKFFRADNIKEKEPDGTGLGLYIVKAALEQSGGKIWFESEENKGTTFYITIPLNGMRKRKDTKQLFKMGIED